MVTRKQTQLNSEELAVGHHDYNRGMNSYAFFKVHDHSMGEDLVQDTFTKTWVYLVKGGKIIMMKAFLYHVLNNLIIDQYRKKRTTESLDVLMEKGFEPHDEESEHLVNFLDGSAAARHITELPEKYKKIMHMRFVQSMSLQDISTSTGQTKNAVAVKIHRGLEKLKVLCGSKVPLII